MATLQDYMNVYRNGEVLRPIARMTFLRSEDESPYGESIEEDIISGYVEVNLKNGVRRGCSVTLDNSSGAYTPNKYGIWVNRKFLLEAGLNIDGEDYYFPQGVFVVSNPVMTSKDGRTARISGIDKFALLNGQLGGKTQYTFGAPVGSDILDIIRGILNIYVDAPRNQIKIDPKLPILEPLSGVTTTPYTIYEEIGGNYGNILMHLTQFVSRNVYYNELGRLVYEEEVDDSKKGSIWDFGDGDAVYQDSTYEYDFDSIRNSVTVIGDNVNGSYAYYSIENVNLASPNNVYQIGQKLEVIEDPIINTVDLAMERAEYELKRLNVLQSALSFNCIPLYHLDVNKVITITDEGLELDRERFLIESFRLPLGGKSNMTVSVARTYELVLGG